MESNILEKHTITILTVQVIMARMQSGEWKVVIQAHARTVIQAHARTEAGESKGN
jgi:hypothetical protein